MRTEISKLNIKEITSSSNTLDILTDIRYITSMRLTLIILLFGLLTLFPAGAQTYGSQQGLLQLGQEITQNVESHGQRLAVLSFNDLEGKAHPMGQFISEELTTALFKANKFQVIERTLINKLLKEQGLSQTGLVDPQTASKMGKILGVDLIATGTWSDLGSKVKINARLIHTNTAQIAAVASVSLYKDSSLKALLGETSGAQSSDAQPTQRKLVYLQSFQEFPVNQHTTKFGSTLVVRPSQRLGYKVITSPTAGQRQFVLPPKLPYHFQLEFLAFDILRHPQGITPSPLHITFKDDKGALFNIMKYTHQWGFPNAPLKQLKWKYQHWNHIKIVKFGNRVTLFLNHEPMISQQYPELSMLQEFQLNSQAFQNWAFTQFKLFELE